MMDGGGEGGRGGEGGAEQGGEVVRQPSDAHIRHGKTQGNESGLTHAPQVRRQNSSAAP